MRPAGLTEVERAKADGRWDAAYDSPATAVVPEERGPQRDAARPVAAIHDAHALSRPRPELSLTPKPTDKLPAWASTGPDAPSITLRERGPTAARPQLRYLPGWERGERGPEHGPAWFTYGQQQRGHDHDHQPVLRPGRAPLCLSPWLAARTSPLRG